MLLRSSSNTTISPGTIVLTAGTSVDTHNTTVTTIFKKRKSISKTNGPATKKVKLDVSSAKPFPARKRSRPATNAAAGIENIPPPSVSQYAGYSTGDIDDCPAPAHFLQNSTRPAAPHATNAVLEVPFASAVEPVFESLVANPTTTTNCLLEEAIAHLVAVDPSLKAVSEQHHCALFSSQGLAEVIDPFRSLASGICGQQVSGAAAKSIKNKFVALFNEDKVQGEVHAWPTVQQVAATSIEKLRTAGLSQRKAEYIRGLAEQFVDGRLSGEMLLTGTDEEVMEKLVAVRGLGKWSVEMFMCFGLKRMDVLSVGDLGVERGMAAWDGRDVAKLKAKGGKRKYMTEKDMLEKAEPFRPYRSLFMWYMWRYGDGDVEVLEK